MSPDGVKYCKQEDWYITRLEKTFPDSPEWVVKSTTRAKSFMIKYLELDLNKKEKPLTQRDLTLAAETIYPKNQDLQKIFTDRLFPHLQTPRKL